MAGYIKRKGKNYYELVVEAGKDPATGKRRRISKTFRGHERDARKVLVSLENEMVEGNHITPSKITVGAYLDKWKEEHVTLRSLSPKTVESYEYIIDTHLKKAFGGLMLEKLTPFHIQDYIAIVIRRLSPRTLTYILVVFNMALKAAVRHRLLRENPMDFVDRPRRAKKKKMRVLTPKEIAILEDAARDSFLWPVVCMALYTGMRRGEILALRWPDVDLEKRIINVKHSMQRIIRRGIVFKEPKTEAGCRTVEIGPTVISVLRQVRREQLEHRIAYGPDYQNHDLVFCQVNGKPLDPHHMSRRFHRLATSIGLNGFRFHDLRHTHISYLVAQGTPLSTAQERAGHGDLASTVIYTHSVPGKQREAADRFEITFGRNPAEMPPQNI